MQFKWGVFTFNLPTIMQIRATQKLLVHDYEAKNSYFKRIAQLGNFKNIALSIARCHQKLTCAFINSEDFFDEAIIVPECRHIFEYILFYIF